jgi:hypothetical protein
MARKVGPDAFQKFPLTKHRKKPRIIFIETVEQPKPILAVIDLQPLE